MENLNGRDGAAMKTMETIKEIMVVLDRNCASTQECRQVLALADRTIALSEEIGQSAPSANAATLISAAEARSRLKTSRGGAKPPASQP